MFLRTHVTIIIIIIIIMRIRKLVFGLVKDSSLTEEIHTRFAQRQEERSAEFYPSFWTLAT
jgi:hypothetical protein